MWLAEVPDAVPSTPVRLHWHPMAKSGLAGPTAELARFAGPTAELATPCVTDSQSGLMAGYRETVLRVLVLSHLKRSQLDHL